MKIKVNGEEKKIDLDQENALLSTALKSMGYNSVNYIHSLYKVMNLAFYRRWSMG